MSTRRGTSAPTGAAEPEEQQEELLAVRRQLVVFARELGELYRTERGRSAELEGALDKLERAYLATMKTLAFVVEAKDVGTRGHHDRTHRYALALTELIDPDLAANHEAEYGFLLHDIGKVGIPESILAKRGALTPEEWDVMKTHPLLGAQIVAPMEFLGRATDVILYHHEAWNGGGYPRGLAGTEIPLAARIFSVVDAFDAMTSDRPYRAAMPIEQAMDELTRYAGSQFDPDVVRTFAVLVENLAQLEQADPPTLLAGTAS